MSRLFGLLSLTMLGLCQATNSTAGFFIQVVFNDGNPLTEHRSCSEDDFYKIQDAMAEVPAGRRLGSTHRELPNCPGLCCDYAWLQCAVYGCQGRYPTPSSNRDGCDRRLEESSGPNEDIVFIDPEDPMWYGDRRSLTQLVTIDECNAKRAEIYAHLLATLPDVATRCNNFVLGPVQMQCVVVTN